MAASRLDHRSLFFAKRTGSDREFELSKGERLRLARTAGRLADKLFLRLCFRWQASEPTSLDTWACRQVEKTAE